MMASEIKIIKILIIKAKFLKQILVLFLFLPANDFLTSVAPQRYPASDTNKSKTQSPILVNCDEQLNMNRAFKSTESNL